MSYYTPTGTIILYGKNQFKALCDALEVANDMLEAIETTEDDDNNDPTIEIKAVTSKAFRVSVSSIIHYEEDDN